MGPGLVSESAGFVRVGRRSRSDEGRNPFWRLLLRRFFHRRGDHRRRRLFLQVNDFDFIRRLDGDLSRGGPIIFFFFEVRNVVEKEDIVVVEGFARVLVSTVLKILQP